MRRLYALAAITAHTLLSRVSTTVVNANRQLQGDELTGVVVGVEAVAGRNFQAGQDVSSLLVSCDVRRACDAREKLGPQCEQHRSTGLGARVCLRIQYQSDRRTGTLPLSSFVGRGCFVCNVLSEAVETTREG